MFQFLAFIRGNKIGVRDVGYQSDGEFEALMCNPEINIHSQTKQGSTMVASIFDRMKGSYSNTTDQRRLRYICRHKSFDPVTRLASVVFLPNVASLGLLQDPRVDFSKIQKGNRPLVWLACARGARDELQALEAMIATGKELKLNEKESNRSDSISAFDKAREIQAKETILLLENYSSNREETIRATRDKVLFRGTGLIVFFFWCSFSKYPLFSFPM